MGSIYLLRHAQASFGAADYDVLSDLGHRQSAVLGETLKARVPRVTRIVAGTMKRHRHTAEICRAAMGCELEITVDEGWNEYDHEVVLAGMDGLASDPRTAFERALARWIGGGEGYREPWKDFRARVMAALGRVGAALGESENALVFTSGGPISTVSSALLHVPEERHMHLCWTLANGSITKLVARGETIHLSTLNEHAHFERALVTWL